MRELNELIIETGDDPAWRLQDHTDGKVLENGLVAGETVVEVRAEVRRRRIQASPSLGSTSILHTKPFASASIDTYVSRRTIHERGKNALIQITNGD